MEQSNESSHDKEKFAKLTEKKKKKQKKVTAKCAQHDIFTHFPKDPDCPICMMNKVQRAQCRSSTSDKAVDALPVPINFADAITLDHKVLNEDDKSRDSDRNICVICDRATYWLQAYPDVGKSAAATKLAIQRFFGTANNSKTHVFRQFRRNRASMQRSESFA